MKITETQKTQITIAISLLLSILIYVSNIQPMQKQIIESTTERDLVKSEQEAMQQIVDNVSIISNYQALRDEYQIKFQERFENFKSNERIENITNDMNIPIVSMKINDFQPVNKIHYESYVAQPKNQEDLKVVQTNISSPVFPMLLSSEVKLRVDVNFLEELNMYDAFNNIEPVGPGSGDKERYCFLVPNMRINDIDASSPVLKRTVEYEILVFAMETMDLSVWDTEFEEWKSSEGVK